MKDSFNYIEVGWKWDIVGGSPRRVFWATREDGLYEKHSTSYTPSGGSDKSFKIENGNSDYQWPIYYEGNFLASPNVGFQHGQAGTSGLSEREYNGDNLYMHIQGMQTCTNNCNSYHNPPNQVVRYDLNAGLWHGCRVDDREYYIKDSSC